MYRAAYLHAVLGAIIILYGSMSMGTTLQSEYGATALTGSAQLQARC